MIIGLKTRFRPIEESDLERLAQWINDPEISHLVGGFSFPLSMTEQREWFLRSHQDKRTQRWIVESHEGVVLGLTGLWEIDWRNRHALTALKLGAAEARGKGYGTDAILTLMSYAFYQVGLNRLWGEILPYNVGSYRAYVEKCGWKVEGVFRQHVLRDGVLWDQLRVAALKSDFDALPAAADYIPRQDSRRVDVTDGQIVFRPNVP